MAKETKSTEKTAVVSNTTTVENIYEKIENANVAKEDFGKDVLEKIQKEKDDRTKAEMKIRYTRCQYSIESELLDLRRERELAKVTKMKLTLKDRLARLMMGFDVTEDVIKHAASLKDETFGFEEADEKAKTITITVDSKKTTYKVGDHIAPVIDYVDYDSLCSKIREFTSAKCREIEQNNTKYYNKLRAAYGDYWNHSWDY